MEHLCTASRVLGVRDASVSNSECNGQSNGELDSKHVSTWMISLRTMARTHGQVRKREPRALPKLEEERKSLFEEMTNELKPEGEGEPDTDTKELGAGVGWGGENILGGGHSMCKGLDEREAGSG